MVFENIPVRPETKKLVDDLGEFKETYDDIIKRLIKSHSCCTCVTSQENEVGVGDEISFDEADK